MTDLEKTYRDEGPQLLNWIKRRLGVNEDSEDLLQDIFTRAAGVLEAVIKGVIFPGGRGSRTGRTGGSI